MTAILLLPAGASPRLYSRHKRHSAGRTRYSNQRVAWLTAQAARLSSDAATLEATLTNYTANQIEVAADLRDLS